MRMPVKLCLGTAAVLFVLFSLGITGRGQEYLIGKPATDYWQCDDQYMGAGLAPYFYCLAPAIILSIIGGMLYVRDRSR